MTVDNEKKLDSYLAYIKGELITNFTDEESIEFIEWSKKKIADTIKDRKEKEILKQLKTCNDADALKLKQKKRKYLPINYPYDLHIGDIAYVNFGFGYCSELSDGHYGIILSAIKANMYLVLPLSSEPLKIYESYLEGLNLPNKNAIGIEKNLIYDLTS